MVIARAEKPTTKKRSEIRKGATKNAPTPAEIEQRRHTIAVLIAAKVPQHLIAQRLGISTATFYRDLAAVKEGFREAATVEIAEVIGQELASLNEAEQRLWAEQLTQQPIDPKAVVCLLQIHDRRARLLGLDKPRKVEVSGPDGGPIQIAHDESALLDEVERLTERLAQMPRRQPAPITDTST